MAARKKRAGYQALRPHAARILKVAEYPTHVNGAYLDDPHRIPLIRGQGQGQAQGQGQGQGGATGQG